MLTASLIVLLALAFLALVGFVGVCCNQSFWFWLFIGGDCVNAFFAVIGAIITAIADSNS